MKPPPSLTFPARLETFFLRVGLGILILLFHASAAIAGKGLWTSHGPEGGYVTAVVVSTLNPSIVYAATYGRGVFRSDDRGLTWVESNLGLGDASVPSLAMDSQDTTILYAATKVGVFRSTDGAASWHAANAGLTSLVVLTLTADPTIASTVYAGTSGGLFRSADRGEKWEFVSSNQVNKLVIESASVFFIGNSAGLAKSVDGGKTWFAAGPVGVIGDFAIGPAGSNIVFASTIDPAGRYLPPGGLHISNDGGRTWRKLYADQAGLVVVDPRPPATVYTVTDQGLVRSPIGGFVWSRIPYTGFLSSLRALVIDPTDSANLYAGTDAGMLKSADGGNTWTTPALDITARSVASVLLDPSNSARVYADGYISDSGGQSWRAAGVGLLSACFLAADPTNSSVIYAGAQQGQVFKSGDSGETWTSVSNGLSGSTQCYNPSFCKLAIDTKQTSRIYALGDTPGGCAYKTVDGGLTWFETAQSLFPRRASDLALDSSNPDTLYAGTSQGEVFRSIDGADSWALTGVVKDGIVIRSVLVDPATPTRIYAGTEGAGVFRSDDAGISWFQAGLDGQKIVTLVRRSGFLFAATAEGVFRATADAGNWIPLNEGLLNKRVLALTIDDRGCLLHAATSGGVFDLDLDCRLPVPRSSRARPPVRPATPRP